MHWVFTFEVLPSFLTQEILSSQKPSPCLISALLLLPTVMGFAQRIPMCLLRLLALGAAVTAAVVMFTSHDTAQVFNMTFEAKYSNSPTFKYFLIINAAASVYTLIVFFCPVKNTLGQFLLVSDLIVMLLLDSSISACLAIGQVGKNGNAHAGWLPICNQVPKFCDRITGALIAGFVASIIYFIIVLLSLHNVFNIFTIKA